MRPSTPCALGTIRRSSWTPGKVDLAAWDASFLAHRTLAAVEGETIVGFADMDGSGYLDRLYVHRDFQRRGVATTLCDTLEAATAAETFTTHASRTARPFFECRGWRVTRERTVFRRGVALNNFVMEKFRVR